jgi:hypothetical protein
MITRTLTARSEWLGFAAQAAAIGTSLVVDKLPRAGTVLFGVLLVVHLGLAAFTRAWGRGPFTSGPPWGAAWLACCALVPVTMALLVAPGQYGSTAQCVQLCAYPIGPVAMFAFYPWGMAGRQWRRVPVQILAMAGIALEPLLVILLINGTITTTNIKSVTFSAVLVALAFLAGLEVRRICTSSSELHFSGLENAYRSQHRVIHDLVRTAIITARTGDPEQVPTVLERLTRDIDQVEYDLNIAAADVNVLRLLRRLRDDHPDRVRLDAPAGIGHLPQPVGELIGRCARNLVGNALQHGGSTVDVTFRLDVCLGVAELEVADDGAGFDPRTFDNKGTTLHDLRQDARARGGDLDYRRSGGRTEVRLYVSVVEPR